MVKKYTQISYGFCERKLSYLAMYSRLSCWKYGALLFLPPFAEAAGTEERLSPDWGRGLGLLGLLPGLVVLFSVAVVVAIA